MFAIMIELGENFAALLSLIFLFSFFSTTILKNRSHWLSLIVGFLFSLAAIAGMLHPIKVVDGVIVDARIILVALAGTFGGPFAALIAVIVVAAYRIYLGGIGTLAGVVVIVLAGIIGSFFSWGKIKSQNRFYYFGLLGLTLAGVALAAIFLLPHDISFSVFSELFLPVLIIYPIATLFYGASFSFELDRQETLQKLCASEADFRLLAENSTDMISRHDAQGNYIYVSPASNILLGYSPQELLGHSFVEFMHPDDVHTVEQSRLKIINQPVSLVTLFRARRKNGEHIWLETVSHAIFDKARAVCEIHAVSRDVTARKHVEDVLGENQHFLDKILNSSPNLIYIYDLLEQKNVYANRETLEFLGYNQEMIKSDGADLMTHIAHPDDLAKIAAHHQRFATANDNDVLEIEYRLKDAQQNWCWVRSRDLLFARDSQGRAWQIIGVAENITARKLAEDRLRQSEAQYRVLIEQASDGIFVTNDRWQYIDVNPAGCELLGYTREEILQLKLTDVAVARPEAPFRFEELRQGKVVINEREMIRKDGSLVATEISARQLPGGGFQAIVRDITQRKQAEAHIQSQFEHLNALHKIDNAIKSSDDLHTTLKIFLNEVTTQLKVDAASVLLFNKHTLTLDHAASHGFHTNVLEYTRLRPGEGYAGEVMLGRKTICISDFTKAKSELIDIVTRAGENFNAYIGSPLIAKGQVVGVLEILQRSTLAPEPDWFDFLDILAGQAAIAIDNTQLFDNLQRSNFELTIAYDATIEGWSHALDLRDKETEGHTQRVTNLTVKLAEQMGIPDVEILHIRRGALLHDIGKMGVPDSILHKPDQLSPAEWEIMRQHTTYAYEMLLPILYLKPALSIPYCHHEKWDGTGYPRGLAGEQIPLAARIFAIMDVYDALTSDRPYRIAWSKEKTMEHVRSLSGTHFDPEIVKWFFRLMEDQDEGVS